MRSTQRRRLMFFLGCLVLAGAAGLRYLVIMASHVGDGQHLDSSNRLHEALAMSYSKKCFWGGYKEYYEFSVTDKSTTDTIRRIRMERLDGTPRFLMREAERIINWSSDSSQVTFAFQDIELKLKIEQDNANVRNETELTGEK